MVDETIPIPTTRVNPSKTGFVTSCRSGLRCRSRWSLADVGAPRIFESDVAANERRPRVFGRDLATEGCARVCIFAVRWTACVSPRASDQRKRVFISARQREPAVGRSRPRLEANTVRRDVAA
jgi:hypothetical protein